MQKIVASYFPFSHHGDATASLQRLWRFYGVPTECYCVPAEFQLAIDCALTARSGRAHGVLGAATARARRARGVQSVLTASFINFIFKTARRYLRKRHSSSDSRGLTHTFAIRFVTSSIAIRIGGKNKKLKAVKNRGKWSSCFYTSLLTLLLTTQWDRRAIALQMLMDAVGAPRERNDRRGKSVQSP